MFFSVNCELNLYLELVLVESVETSGSAEYTNTDNIYLKGGTGR